MIASAKACGSFGGTRIPFTPSSINSGIPEIVVEIVGIPIAIVWAIAGAVVGWQGGTLFGGTVLGICGAVSGAVLGAFALGGDALLIFLSALTGLVYGGIAGLIIGKAFPKTAHEPK